MSIEPGANAESLAQFLERHNSTPDDLPLVKRALTHPSYAFEHGLEHDYERLEFLGDAVIDMLVAEQLYRKYSDASEGQLTRWRADLVSRDALGKIADRIDLDKLILLGRGEEKMGGRKRFSTIGSCLEAVVGALYLERGIDICRDLTIEFIMPHKLPTDGGNGGPEAKTKLQEWLQARKRELPVYEILSSTGPDHNKVYTAQVSLAGQVYGTGTGSRKQAAQAAAASAALKILIQEELAD